MLSGSGLCDELITCPEESYRLWCVVCDLENRSTLFMFRLGAAFRDTSLGIAVFSHTSACSKMQVSQGTTSNITLYLVVNVSCLVLNNSRVRACVRACVCMQLPPYEARGAGEGREENQLICSSQSYLNSSSSIIPPVHCTSSTGVSSIVTFCTSLFTRAAPLSSEHQCNAISFSSSVRKPGLLIQVVMTVLRLILATNKLF